MIALFDLGGLKYLMKDSGSTESGVRGERFPPQNCRITNEQIWSKVELFIEIGFSNNIIF